MCKLIDDAKRRAADMTSRRWLDRLNARRAVFVDAALRGAIVLLVALVADALAAPTLGRRAPRHLVWVGAIVVQLVLPLFAIWGPRWESRSPTASRACCRSTSDACATRRRRMTSAMRGATTRRPRRGVVQRRRHSGSILCDDSRRTPAPARRPTLTVRLISGRTRAPRRSG